MSLALLHTCTYMYPVRGSCVLTTQRVQSVGLVYHIDTGDLAYEPPFTPLLPG
jgi:hypothetical protein